MKSKLAILSITLLYVSACSPSSAVSPEGAGAGAIGGLLGIGAGYLANKIDSRIIPEKAAVLGAGVGAGLGLAAGALIYEDRIERQKELPAIRKVKLSDDGTQREIDAARKQMEDSTKWGQGEVLPWEQRYWDEESSTPYQGNSTYGAEW